MRNDGGLAIKVETENWQTHARITAQRLRELVARIGGEGDRPRADHQAYEALESRGITARENFTCCHSCGTSEIGAERGAESRRFVFFHSQCTEGAAAGHGLMLLYGGFDRSAGTTTAVGHEVVAALTAAGLSTEWDGDPASAITVTPLTWRKHLVG